ncbi:MAG: YicC/YloC family endoribonuclease [Bradymonadia bacterium]
MSLRSMTGFGRAEGRTNGRGFVVEVRSVNHRYLDVRGRLPKGLSAIEMELKKLVEPFARRGRIDLQVLLGPSNEKQEEVRLDVDAAERHLERHKVLAERLGVEMTCSSTDLIQAPGVLKVSEDSDVDELDVEDVKAAIAEALLKLQDMRIREGEQLEVGLRELIEQSRSQRELLIDLVERQTNHHQTKLVERMKEAAVADDEAMNTRIMMEAGLLAERVDVQEELDRLTAHFDQFEEICSVASEEPVGRRLDFLCQEIVREINTTASKSQSVDITRVTIELKTLMERVREQVQNVE